MQRQNVPRARDLKTGDKKESHFRLVLWISSNLIMQIGNCILYNVLIYFSVPKGTRGSHLILQLNGRDNGFICVYCAGLGWAGLGAFPGDWLKLTETTGTAEALLTYANVRRNSQRSRHPFTVRRLWEMSGSRHKGALLRTVFLISVYRRLSSQDEYLAWNAVIARLFQRTVYYCVVCTLVPWLRKQLLWFQ